MAVAMFEEGSSVARGAKQKLSKQISMSAV
jgi:hypothetical protein